MKRMSFSSRIIIAIASLALATIYFLPVWFIYLIAPQYPEGLTMNIWLYKITGQVDIINGLNHYIGMKHIKEEMFPEFKYLIYIVAFFILFGLLVAITGRKKLLLAFLILTILAGAAAMYDFHSWGYDYGHNLDPTAAIQVPGLFYQPPLIGHKRLLNFDAYSYPDSGGWVIIGVATVLFSIWFLEWRRNRKPAIAIISFNKKLVPAAVVIVLSLASCSTKPQPIAYGKDICDDCRMTIMDSKFAGEIITRKGKIYKFDDVHCLAHFLKAGNIKTADIVQTVFIDYENNKNFLDINSLFFVVSPKLKSPMNGNAAAFVDKSSAARIARETDGEIKDWASLLQTQ